MPSPAKRPRDPRLDFFRGLAMFIIFIAHVPGNAWNDWIPARFGFSSGAELFVFCSGAASAMAFGTVFVRSSWRAGAWKILARMRTVYAAHLGLLAGVLAIATLADALFGGRHLAQQFEPFPPSLWAGIASAAALVWQPAYVDILPMYVVVLGMVPVVMALRARHPLLPFMASLALWGAVWAFGLTLPGNIWSGEPWFFNPFAWQLVFFTGFAFMSGWLAVPLRRPALLWPATLFLLASLPVAFWGIRERIPALVDLYAAILPVATEKPDLHILRYIHFLALAYVVLSLVEPWRDRLGRGLGAVVVTVGQQSLVTFLASLVMARFAWIALDELGRGPLDVALVNLGGFSGIVAVAYTSAALKARARAAIDPSTSRLRATG